MHMLARKSDYYSLENMRSFQPLLEDEPIEPRHPMAIISCNAVRKILDIYTKTNCALYASKVTNTYSGLGGSYTSYVTKDFKQGNIVVLPLITNVTQKDKSIKSTF